MYRLVRPLLFQLDPETAHEWTLRMLGLADRARLLGLFFRPPAADPVECMGLKFPNRVGLAAGMDKDGACPGAWGRLGFGHIELGTVTPRPQPGNPKPRLFRLIPARAVINRMGFNNHGARALVRRLENHTFPGVIGINIGKNFDTPLESAAGDYLACLAEAGALADYIAVNISSPNTPGLRDLQKTDAIRPLLQAITAKRDEIARQRGRPLPVAVKIAPDLEDDALPQIARIVEETAIDAVIATNTTVARAGVQDLKHGSETGGLSGAPLKSRSLEVVRRLRDALPARIPIIGVGGILSGADTTDMLRAGARLVQIYTGIIYRGPALVREAVQAGAAFGKGSGGSR